MQKALEGLPLDPEAAELLRDYRNRLERALQRHRLPEEERHEILREIESHLYERLSRLAAAPIEPQHVLDVLYKLGEPESYVPLYLTHSDLGRGLRGSPRHLLRGWGRWARATAAQYLLSFPFVLCYLLSLVLMGVGFFRLALPENFHVYATLPRQLLDGERALLSFGFSFSAPTSASDRTVDAEADVQRVELLSPWGAAAVFGAGFGIALLATWLLRRLLRRLLLHQYGI